MQPNALIYTKRRKVEISILFLVNSDSTEPYQKPWLFGVYSLQRTSEVFFVIKLFLVIAVTVNKKKEIIVIKCPFIHFNIPETKII